jgi:peptide deformylase|tara:strand:- start:2560 stop:2988 length:429 start_codon:yes stop_codon:yes gene_type:complete
MKLVDKSDKILKTVCDEHILSEHSEKLVYDMIVAMQEADAIGLAAPQVGENTRLMVIGHEDNGFVVCINPVWEVAEDSEDEDFLEGCVSFPGLELTINRPNKIDGTFTDLNGFRKTSTFVGVWAQAFQHECDHLNGVTFDTL